MTEDEDTPPAEPEIARIQQPELRDLYPNERIVRVAGLKFILPGRWQEGDVLTEEDAIFINTAFHTAVINRFAPTREALLADPATGYEDLEDALLDFLDSYKWTPRPASHPSDDVEPLTEDERDLVRFARPHFNKAMKGTKVSRADYEATLRKWVLANKSVLEPMLEAELKRASDAKGRLARLMQPK